MELLKGPTNFVSRVFSSACEYIPEKGNELLTLAEDAIYDLGKRFEAAQSSPFYRQLEGYGMRIHKFADELIPTKVDSFLVLTEDISDAIRGIGEHFDGTNVNLNTNKQLSELRFTNLIDLVRYPIKVVRNIKMTFTGIKIGSISEVAIRGVQSGIAVLGTLDAAMLIPLLMDYFMPSSFVQQSLNILGPAAVVLGGLLSTLYIIPDAIKLIKAGWLTFELFQAESVEDKLECFTSYLAIDLESIIDKSQNGRLVSVKDADDSLVTADEKKAIRQQLSTRYGNDYTAEHFWTAVDAVSKAHQKRHCELRVALGQTGLALVQGLRDGSKTMKPDEAVDLLTHQLKRRLLRRSVRMIVSLLSLSSTILLLISTSHIAVLITTGIWLLSTLVNFYFTSTGWINAQKEETSSTGYLPMFISAVVFLATITAAILLTTTPVGYVGIALLSLLWIGMMGYTIYSIHMKKEKLDVFGRPL